MASDLLAALLDTQALRLPPAGDVFWYTSGTVGPYYINTEYLYGGSEGAEELLAFIDADKGEEDFPFRLRERVEKQYAGDEVYRRVIDALVVQAQESGARFEAVSGGERRDWFFSLAVAERLGMPHLLIYKDLSKMLLAGGDLRPVERNEMDVLHVADLVTEASSYFRSWIPVVAEGGGKIACAANVIDRGQGGIEALNEKGVEAGALLRVDEALFGRLLEMGRIGEGQFEVLVNYYRDPHAAMKAFLEGHPEFLRNALNGDDEKAAQRARLLVSENTYGLDEVLWRD
jgi:orotate phosphoribosyltransferase